jgi:hypothetical protein
MATKAKPRAASRVAPALSPSELLNTPPVTTEDRIVRIRALGQRIHGHIQYICGAGSLVSTSTEAKEKATTVFYERLVVLERQLAQIQEGLELQ